MPRGIAEACAMASAATPKIDDSAMETLGIHRMRDSGRRADRQNHPERDQRQIAVEQDRAVDGGQRPELFDDAFDFREQRIAKEVAERRSSRRTVAGSDDWCVFCAVGLTFGSTSGLL